MVPPPEPPSPLSPPPPPVQTCEELGWSAGMGDDDCVCSKAAVDGSNTCSGTVSYDDAVEWCSVVGARLCTQSELLSQDAMGAGCGLNNKNIWSSTSCGDDGHYALTGKGAAADGWNDGCVNGTSIDVAHAACCADSSAGGCGPTSPPPSAP